MLCLQAASPGRCGGFRGRISFLGSRFLVGIKEALSPVLTHVLSGGQERPGQVTEGSVGPSAVPCGTPAAGVPQLKLWQCCEVVPPGDTGGRAARRGRGLFPRESHLGFSLRLSDRPSRPVGPYCLLQDGGARGSRLSPCWLPCLAT